MQTHLQECGYEIGPVLGKVVSGNLSYNLQQLIEHLECGRLNDYKVTSFFSLFNLKMNILHWIIHSNIAQEY